MREIMANSELVMILRNPAMAKDMHAVLQEAADRIEQIDLLVDALNERCRLADSNSRAEITP